MPIRTPKGSGVDFIPNSYEDFERVFNLRRISTFLIWFYSDFKYWQFGRKHLKIVRCYRVIMVGVHDVVLCYLLLGEL